MSLVGVEPVTSALEELSSALGASVVVVASSWRKGAQVNLDESALVALRAVLERTTAAQARALFVMGRGGRAGFADGVRRLFGEALATSYVGGLTTGALTLSALCAQEVVLGQGAGLGAFDVGPLGPMVGRWSVDLLPRLTQLPLIASLEPERQAPVALGLAMQAQERMIAGHLCSMICPELDDRAMSQLMSHWLGDSLGLDVAQLLELGLKVRASSADERRLCGRLEQELASLLLLHEPTGPRFVASELANEVEFEMATTEVGAVIASAEAAWIYELDTGRPDPDTGLFDGAWVQV